MTASVLLAYIGVVLVVQLALGIGVAVLRRRGASRAADVADSVPSPGGPVAGVGWRELRVTRKEHEDGAQTQCSFYLEPVDGKPLWPFTPGQFLTFALPAPAEDGEPRALTRCYSLSDRPSSTTYRVTVKRVLAPEGRPELPAGVSSSHFHERIHPGDMLRVKAPAGKFCIDSAHDVPVVLVAGGIGITPLMSMLTWCLAEQPERTVHLYYGVRRGSEHAFKQTLEALARSHPRFHLTVVYSRPERGDVLGRDFQHAGHVDVDLLRRTLPHGRHRFYVCGPPPLMEALVPALAAWGARAEDIRHEAFGPASVNVVRARPDAGASLAPLEVRFQRSGRTLVWDGSDESLLDFAERHLVQVESGCRSGSCGSCAARLVSGTVGYAEEPDHEIPPGHCLLCVGTPKTSLVLEA